MTATQLDRLPSNPNCAVQVFTAAQQLYHSSCGTVVKIKYYTFSGSEASSCYSNVFEISVSEFFNFIFQKENKNLDLKYSIFKYFDSNEPPRTNKVI